MIFAARQLQEKCQEQIVDLYSTYVDLTKAFDTVSREGLWKSRRTRNFIAIVRQLHDGILATVQDNGVISEPFPVCNGGKQGRVLAPTLFTLMFSAMLTDAFRDPDIGIGTDGSFISLRGSKQKPGLRQTPSGTFCLPMTVPSTLPPKLTCNTVLIGSQTPATTSA